MNEIWKMALSLSLSGALLILVLLLCRPLIKDRFSKRWQYYIWLVVIARLLLPFAPEESLVGELFRRTEEAVAQSASKAVPTDEPSAVSIEDALSMPDVGEELLAENDVYSNTNRYKTDRNSTDGDSADKSSAVNSEADYTVSAMIMRNLRLVWLGGALILFVRRLTAYQSFVKYIKAGWTEVSDIALLEQLARMQAQVGIQRPIELCTNGLISSPLLFGFFRPCIVLPTLDLSESDFGYTIRHELIHYKRRDMYYKWLVQITVCLHWFNPLVWLMEREINRACELSCDEAVICGLDTQERQAYGDTLVHAMGIGGECKHLPVSVTLNESAKLLKERLSAIMGFKTCSRWIAALSVLLALILAMGATAAGAYTGAFATDVYESVAAADAHTASSVSRQALPSGTASEPEKLILKGTTYYLVFNEEQLRAIAAGEYGMDKNFMQQADITLSADEWIPIGTWDNPFTGTYNGNGYAIIGLTMTDPDATLVGLFGFAQNANIYNVTLRDYDIVHAGEKALRKSVGAILAVAGSGARSYDNFCYPREEAEAVEAYYQDRNLPEFKKAFALLEEDKQRDYLERSYADGAIALFSEAVSCLPVDSPMIDEFAQRAYAEQETAFFSILTGNMSRNALEKWLERAASDRQTAFYSILSGAPGQKPEPPEISKEEEAQRLDAYRAHGITQEGAVYYYQGEIVGILLDIHSDNSFVFLNMNPEGTANIKITRDRDDAIMQVSRMTAKEVEELFREDEKESFAEGPEIERPEIEELPAAVQREMNNCSIRTWYVLAYDGREYIWYNGFAWEYAWKYDYEMWQKEGVRIDIVKLKKKDAGYVLLSVPEGDTLQLSVDGELVEYTELAVR